MTRLTHAHASVAMAVSQGITDPGEIMLTTRLDYRQVNRFLKWLAFDGFVLYDDASNRWIRKCRFIPAEDLR